METPDHDATGDDVNEGAASLGTGDDANEGVAPLESDDEPDRIRPMVGRSGQTGG